MVLRRANQYIELIWTGKSRYATQQVRDVADAMGNPQAREKRLAVKRTIQENYETSEIVVETIEEARAWQSLNGDMGNLTQFLCKIDYNVTLPMLLYKHLETKGLKNKDVYRKIDMKADTFAKILSGRYGMVKKENVMRLCVGLKLTLEEAEEFMASAGYLFSKGIMRDVVVRACLSYRIYEPDAIDAELYEHNAPVLFSEA